MVADKADQSGGQKAQEGSVDTQNDPSVETKVELKNEVVNKDSPKDEKPVPTNSTTNEESEQSKPAEDATLILSAEEEAEIAAQTNEDVVKPSQAPASKEKKVQRNVWVSNISRGTKAADLKKLFSVNFKVESAKIVTNGKSFFGYICLESAEMAQKSTNELNGSTLGGKKIAVSLSRPDLRSSRTSTADIRRGREARVSNGVKKSETSEGVQSEKREDQKEGGGTEAGKDAKESTDDKKKEVSVEEKLKIQQRKEEKANRLIRELKTDLKRISTELQNNRRRLNDADRRLEMEREKKTSMRREIEHLEAQLKSERRRFSQELEQMEKKRKMDESRYQDDRTVLNKELDECRKLREYLQRKIDELGISRHGRSPPHRSGPGGRSMSERGSDKMGRSRMHPSDSRGVRSPPPPPKINNRRSRDRSPYKGGKKPRLDDSPNQRQSNFGNNHYQGQSASFPGNAKPLLGHYPQAGPQGGPPRQAMYASTAYPEPARYGSYLGGGGNPGMFSRPIGYPDIRGSGAQRKY